MKSEDDENGVEDENGIDDENGVEDENEEENKPSLPCPHCKRFFWYKSKLQMHIFTHTGEKPHKCPYCPGAAFALFGNYKGENKSFFNKNKIENTKFSTKINMK
jgi:hypothetical protein